MMKLMRDQKTLMTKTNPQLRFQKVLKKNFLTKTLLKYQSEARADLLLAGPQSLHVIGRTLLVGSPLYSREKKDQYRLIKMDGIWI